MVTETVYTPISERPRLSSHPLWKRPYSVATIVFTGDLLLTFAPCLFIVLAVEAVLADKSSPEWAKAVKEAAKVSPSIFPVVFAAIVGRLMKSLALWYAERGASLGLLEQMTGSQNLAATLERFIFIPGVSVWSYFIVLLWLLSPIGGQSSMRVNVISQVLTSNETTVHYFNTTGDGISSAFAGTGISSMKETTLNGVLHSGMLSLKRSKQHDMWGNIKIPFLEYTSSFAGGVQEQGWYNFSQDTYKAQYSAMTGVVVSGLRNGLDTAFKMQSSYFNVTCDEQRFFPMNNYTYGTARYGGFVEWAGDLLVHKDLSEDLFTLTVGKNQAFNSYLLDTSWGTTYCQQDGGFNMVFASQGANQIEIAAYKCSVGLIAVESDVLCKSSDCQVRRIRLAQSESDVNRLPFSPQDSPIPGNLFRWLSTATWMSDKSIVSPIDWYISGSDMPFPRVDTSDYKDHDVSYRNVSTDIVSQRLASLINTGYQASHQLSALTQPASDNATALSLSLESSTAHLGVGYSVVKTSATVSSVQSRYVSDKLWVASTIIIALVLLLCGIFGMIFKYAVQTPDILGFVSSQTRDNPSFEHIADGDRLDGLERAWRLRHLKVQIVDVKPFHEDGYISLRSLGYKNNREDPELISHLFQAKS